MDSHLPRVVASTALLRARIRPIQHRRGLIHFEATFSAGGGNDAGADTDLDVNGARLSLFTAAVGRLRLPQLFGPAIGGAFGWHLKISV